jgi:5'-3' exonuclease
VAHRLLLDTSSLMYRAFFALPQSITDPRGSPVNALHGYLDMTARLARERGTTDLVHCLDDDWRPAPRVAAYDGYKAKRPEEPEVLTRQFEELPGLVEVLGMAWARAVGWEAEDAIGSIAARAGTGDRVEVVTGDRDLIQLVRDPVVRVLITRRGVSNLEELDEEGVLRRFSVPAARYADFAVLRGDPSDGLPGVPGVGEKTARELVLAYPSLGALLEAVRAPRRTKAVLQRSPGLRARLLGAEGYLAAMREVVPIRTDLEVELRRGEPDPDAAARIGERLGLGGPIRRLGEAMGPR